MVACFCVHGQNQIQSLEGRPEHIRNHASREYFSHFEVQIVVQKSVLLDLLFFLQIDLDVLLIFIEVEKFVIIEKENSLGFEKVDQEIIKSSDVYGQVNITMELCFQESVIDISNRIDVDPNVDGDHVV